MSKGSFRKPASIIISTLLLLFPTGDIIYSTYGFFVIFNQQSEFLGQLQRIVAQLYKTRQVDLKC